MFDLVYPSYMPPVLPPRRASDVDAPEPQRKTEMFPVVEPDGEVVAMASREYCHSGAKVLHPVVHLHIIDRYGRLYLQKRSLKKDIQPGKWDTAVGGHVDYGEQLLEALFREASEELGLKEFNPVYLGSYVFESEIEKELVNVFAAVGSFSLSPDKDEVDEGKYWEIGAIEENTGRSVLTPNFEQEFVRVKDRLLALL